MPYPHIMPYLAIHVITAGDETAKRVILIGIVKRKELAIYSWSVDHWILSYTMHTMLLWIRPTEVG